MKAWLFTQSRLLSLRAQTMRLCRAGTHLARHRAASGSALPPHLRFVTPTGPKTCMIVGNPFWSYPVALATLQQPAGKLVEAIKKLSFRPFRIISHNAEDGRVFNSSFFDGQDQMHEFLHWWVLASCMPHSYFSLHLGQGVRIRLTSPSHALPIVL